LLNAKRKPKQGSQPDIITTDRIRGILKYRRKSKKVHNVINEAIYWGALTREWTGSYRINWERCAYVASLPPMNPGDRPLNNRSQHYDKRQWGEFRQALDVIKEFWDFVRAARVQAFARVPLPDAADNLLAPPPSIPPIPNGPRLRYTVLELAGRLVWALVLGLGNIYFVPVGVRGGAQSCFPCVSYGSGKYLCAGSLKALLSILGSLEEPPEPYPYGGHSPRLVIDAGRDGLVPYESFTPTKGKYEPGVQVLDSALLPYLSTWRSIIITSRYRLPRELRGWPALVLELSSGANRAVSYRPDTVRRDLPLIIDALLGLRQSVIYGLRGSSLSPQSSAPYAIALARTVSVRAADPPIDIYIEVIDGFKVREGKNRYRHEGGRRLYRLDEFIKLLSARDRPVVAETIRVIVPLADFPYLKEVLDFGFLFIYHNDRKDPPNAVRAEFRAYDGVLEAHGKEGTMKLALGLLHLLGQPLATTYQALASA
jgi:hypothetical protein